MNEPNQEYRPDYRKTSPTGCGSIAQRGLGPPSTIVSPPVPDIEQCLANLELATDRFTKAHSSLCVRLQAICHPEKSESEPRDKRAERSSPMAERIHRQIDVVERLQELTDDLLSRLEL